MPRIEPNCKAGYCRIEAGCFIMGEPRDEWEIARYASVQVQVTLTHAFWIGQTEIAREQWESVGWAQPVQFFSEATVECEALDCPQGNVSFYDAIAFANRYSEIRGLPHCYELAGCDGAVGNGLLCSQILLTNDSIYDCKGYRLPTEAEWEYAARAGTDTAFHSGDITPQVDPSCYTDPALEPIGWYCANSRNRVHAVAQKIPNCWGLFDISGNVAEWCNDVMDFEGYGSSNQIDPQGAFTQNRDMSSSRDHPARIKRGGAYNRYAAAAKSGFRGSDDDYRVDSSLGFRLVRTVAAGE